MTTPTVMIDVTVYETGQLVKLSHPNAQYLRASGRLEGKSVVDTGFVNVDIPSEAIVLETELASVYDGMGHWTVLLKLLTSQGPLWIDLRFVENSYLYGFNFE